MLTAPGHSPSKTNINSNGGLYHLINAVPYGGKKKGADTGIDGFVYFKPDGKTTEKASCV
jgi:hypothetical protein